MSNIAIGYGTPPSRDHRSVTAMALVASDWWPAVAGTRSALELISDGEHPPMKGLETMTIPVTVTFRNTKPSEALEAEIHARALALARVYDSILGCRVLVDVRHHHHRKGNPFHVRVELMVARENIAINGEAHSNPDPYVAVRQVFDIARRSVERRQGRAA
jgi:ribosome-associated translation inhibitor RaiA